MVEMLAKTVEEQDKAYYASCTSTLHMETHKLLKSAILEIPYPKPDINISGYA